MASVLKPWLQLFRAQTAPATVLLLLTPYLTNAPLFSLTTLLLAVLFTWIHYVSFGENSLMDTAMMYDQRDPHKKHHPLISGAIKLHTAHNVIHWGLSAASLLIAILTLVLAPSPAVALVWLFMWVLFGHAYNEGLSKESLLGFLAICLCFSGMGAWGWFLSHETLSEVGSVYVVYVFFTVLYQISWSGFVKELQIRERSNILTKMGAYLDITWKGKRVFRPGKAKIYAYLVKVTTLILGGVLCWLQFNLVRLVMFVLLGIGIAFYLTKTTKTRIYEREKELLNMSLMEILTIYLPIPLMLGVLEATVLMVGGVLYFFCINVVLWGKPYPRV